MGWVHIHQYLKKNSSLLYTDMMHRKYYIFIHYQWLTLLNEFEQNNKMLGYVSQTSLIKLAVTRDFQQCGNLTSVATDKPVQPLYNLGISKHCSVSSLRLIESSSD